LWQLGAVYVMFYFFIVELLEQSDTNQTP